MTKRTLIGGLVFALLAALCVAVPAALGPSTAAVSGATMKVFEAVPSESAPLSSLKGVPSREAGAFERDYEAEHEGEEADAEHEGAGEGGEARPTEGEGGGGEEKIHTIDNDAARRAAPDGAVDTGTPGAAMPSPLVNFNGIDNNLNPTGPTTIRPPDPNADVGPNDIVEVVNQSIAVYSKTGAIRAGYPKAVNALWASFPSGPVCQNYNDGDPVVVYDQLADRWLVSQFALPNFPSGPFYQCIAVSKTGDPTGAYNRYQFTYSTNKMNDYPKFGVWPDGYYASFNQFNAGSFSWAGAGAVAYQRAKMLQGKTAKAIYFDLFSVDPNAGGQLPSDLNGTNLPPAGAPNYFVEYQADEFGGGLIDELRVWKFHADFATPANSTFTGPVSLPTTPFNPNLCGFGQCVPQQGSGVLLDTLSDRLMYRLNYRRIGSREEVVVSQTVKTPDNRASVRWYEIRNIGTTPTIAQQATLAPPDGLQRWMPSINMDKFGNIAVGYSVSSSTSFPGVRYAGRLQADPKNKLSQGEANMVAGGGATTSAEGRWGDYTSMSVDPVDDCTFWYTGEFVKTTGYASWATRIASFKFPGCP
jgi:hypothetical protein